MTEFRRCTRCIMDNSSDPTIRFNEHGQCNYCTDALKKIGLTYIPNEEGATKLQQLISQVKEAGSGKKYDCIMGLSGGLDSSYLAFLGHKWGLRVLCVHIDDGYDTEISKANLKKLITATGYDYEVITPDPVQYNALTLAYMRAGVPNLATPQDNIIFAFIYDCMSKYDIKYFLSGGNFALECILQQGNSHTAMDLTNIRDIHRRFGSEPIDKLKFISTLQRMAQSRLNKVCEPHPLDFIDYNRDRAFQELEEFCGFQYYGRKHLENILTAFVQLYWFPKKFGVDKRTSHLSSMIVSGQMSREQALQEYAEPLYDVSQMAEYINIIKQNMHICDEEFDNLIAAPPHQHTDYRCETDTLLYKIYRLAHRIHHLGE